VALDWSGARCKLLRPMRTWLKAETMPFSSSVALFRLLVSIFAIEVISIMASIPDLFMRDPYCKSSKRWVCFCSSLAISLSLSYPAVQARAIGLHPLACLRSLLGFDIITICISRCTFSSCPVLAVSATLSSIAMPEGVLLINCRRL